MQIFTLPDGRIVGPFYTIEQLPDGNYLTNGALLDASDVEGGVISEVPDTYLPPEIQAEQDAKFNASQAKLREQAYPIESDPVFFRYQRGLATKDDWLAAVQAVKNKYPYKG